MGSNPVGRTIFFERLPSREAFFWVRTRRRQLLRIRPRPNLLPAETSSGPREAIRLNLLFSAFDQREGLRHPKGGAHDAELHANVGT